MTAQPTSGPTHGALTLNADGSSSYTPDHNYTGDDTFVYVAHDGPLESAPATVTIHVNPNPPANDLKANALALGADSGTYSGSSDLATSDADDPYAFYGYAPTVWFSYTPTHSGQLHLDTCGTSFDNTLVLMDSGGSPINSAYQSCSNGSISQYVTAGTTYLIQVDGYNGTMGNYTLNWNLPEPPANDN